MRSRNGTRSYVGDLLYTYIHSFLDSFPIQVITEYWVEFPVLYSKDPFLFLYKFIYFVFGCVGSSFLLAGFL